LFRATPLPGQQDGGTAQSLKPARCSAASSLARVRRSPRDPPPAPASPSTAPLSAAIGALFTPPDFKQQRCQVHRPCVYLPVPSLAPFGNFGGRESPGGLLARRPGIPETKPGSAHAESPAATWRCAAVVGGSASKSEGASKPDVSCFEAGRVHCAASANRICAFRRLRRCFLTDNAQLFPAVARGKAVITPRANPGA
jgi:hypothetical protein